ncbi:hypothetical protein D3C87_2136780 [compost metagenome]
MICFGIGWNKPHLHSLLFGKHKGFSQPGIIRLHAQQPPYQGNIRPVAAISFSE